jgi:pimeloyl-ACP methyl ester carboxylesterase
MKKLIFFSLTIFLGTVSGIAQNLDWTVSHDTLIVVSDSSAGQSFINILPDTIHADTTKQKLIYWIHGLAGDASSWDRVRSVTEYQSSSSTVAGYPVRKTNGYNPDYSNRENSKIQDAAPIVNDMLFNWTHGLYDTIPINDRIAIAHSQGGIMARAMRDQNYNGQNKPELFGSLVTIGTPHNGAELINNTRPANSNIKPWLTSGCERLLAVEFRQWLDQTPWLVQVLAGDAPQYMAGASCNGLNKLILAKAIGEIRKDISADYAKNSPSLTTLNQVSANDTIPVIVVFGEEEEPVLWRTLYTMTGASKDSNMAGNSLFTDPFSLNSDISMANDMQSLRANYIYKSSLYSFIHSTFSFPLWLVGVNQNTKNRAAEYRRAASWIEKANVTWKRMIGARWDSVYLGDYQCMCNGQVMATVENQSDCWQYNNSCLDFDIIQEYDFNIIEVPSDGVVTVASQKAYPGRVIKFIKMKNTNHMQMRNCSETRRVLNMIFDDDQNIRFYVPRL